jgi:hypothetical protein
VLVALYRDGVTVRVFDRAVPSADQTQLTVTGIASLPPRPNPCYTQGDYRVVLLVNGQQARNSPTIAVP